MVLLLNSSTFEPIDLTHTPAAAFDSSYKSLTLTGKPKRFYGILYHKIGIMTRVW